MTSRPKPKRFDGAQLRAYCDARKAEAASINSANRVDHSRSLNKQHELARNGGLLSVVALLASPDPASAQVAARALKVQSLKAENHKALQRAGAIPALLSLLSHRTSWSATEENAARAIWNLAAHRDNKQCIANAGGIEVMIELVIRSDYASQTAEIAAGVLYSLSLHHDNKLRMVCAGVVPPLISLLENGLRIPAYFAAGALRELSEHTDVRPRLISENCPTSPALRRAIAKRTTLLDSELATTALQASDYFAPHLSTARLQTRPATAPLARSFLNF
jgi:hypothetical protein